MISHMAYIPVCNKVMLVPLLMMYGKNKHSFIQMLRWEILVPTFIIQHRLRCTLPLFQPS